VIKYTGVILLIFWWMSQLIWIEPAVANSGPGWVRQRPVNPEYYIGIGVAQKSNENREYIQRAKNAALSDLASEITVNISSDLLDIAVEQSGLSEERIRREIRASTQAELEGYELVDTWQDNREYWVYYRLSKAKYRERRRQQVASAVSLSLEYYKDGLDAAEQQDYAGMLRYYVQALEPLGPYYAEPLEATFRGKHIYLKNELFTAIQSTLSRMSLKPIQGEIEGKIGRALTRPLRIRALYRNDSEMDVPVNKLRLHFEFLRGSGELQESVTTNRDGQAVCRVSRITGTEKLQMVRASVALVELLPADSIAAPIQGTLTGFSVPDARFILSITGLSAYVESSESNFGKPLDVPAVEPVLKTSLAEQGFTFVEDLSQADILIELEAVSRKGSVVYGQHVAYVDLSLSVRDLTTGKEIEKQAFQDVKGIHLDYERAGLKAFEHAGEKISGEFVPSLLTKIQ